LPTLMIQPPKQRARFSGKKKSRGGEQSPRGGRLKVPKSVQRRGKSGKRETERGEKTCAGVSGSGKKPHVFSIKKKKRRTGARRGGGKGQSRNEMLTESKKREIRSDCALEHGGRIRRKQGGLRTQRVPRGGKMEKELRHWAFSKRRLKEKPGGFCANRFICADL